jgi:hypothetical protein
MFNPQFKHYTFESVKNAPIYNLDGLQAELDIELLMRVDPNTIVFQAGYEPNGKIKVRRLPETWEEHEAGCIIVYTSSSFVEGDSFAISLRPWREYLS